MKKYVFFLSLTLTLSVNCKTLKRCYLVQRNKSAAQHKHLCCSTLWSTLSPGFSVCCRTTISHHTHRSPVHPGHPAWRWAEQLPLHHTPPLHRRDAPEQQCTPHRVRSVFGLVWTRGRVFNNVFNICHTLTPPHPTCPPPKSNFFVNWLF